MYGGRSVRREKEVGGWVKEKQQEQGCSLKTGERCHGTEESKARVMPPFTQRQNSNPLLVPHDVIEPQSLSCSLRHSQKGKER